MGLKTLNESMITWALLTVALGTPGPLVVSDGSSWVPWYGVCRARVSDVQSNDSYGFMEKSDNSLGAAEVIQKKAVARLNRGVCGVWPR